MVLSHPRTTSGQATHNWTGGGSTNFFSDAANWSGGLPMDGDSLVFGLSARTLPVDDLGTLSLATNWTTLSLGTITFAAGAPAYQITISSVGSHVLALNGAGIVNGRTFITEGGSVVSRYGGQLQFFLSASAGSASIINNSETVDNAVSGITEFHNTSTAGSSTITNNGGFFSSQAHTQFFDSSTAGSSTITSTAARSAGIANGTVNFSDNSTAGTATLIANGSSDPNFYGGYTQFGAHSNAGTATVIANGGTSGGQGGRVIFFGGFADAGTARMIINAGGILDISPMRSVVGNTFVSIGSIEGAGTIYLGSAHLIVGGSNRSTEVSGTIQAAGGIWAPEGPDGPVTKVGTGTLTLSGVNAYNGATAVNAGGLIVNGALNAASAVSVASGATLGGSGAVNGAATIASGGTLAPGAVATPGNFTLGSLVLNATSNLNFRLGAPGVVGGANNDLLTINGALTLDGTLNVTNSASFGLGTYRLINFGGALTDNGLGIGTTPAGFTASDLAVQTSVANQVNLVVGPSTAVLFWDGAQTVANNAVDGGTGDWNTTRTNWTSANGATNSAWGNQFAVFSGAAGGAVTLKESVSTTGMQFATAGYTIAADPGQSITLVGATTFRVDPGVAATINAPLTGAGSLTKLDTGTLTLSGANTYTGLTTVTGGALKLGLADAIKSGNALTTGAAGVFDLNGHAETLGLLTNGGNVTNSGAATTLTIGNGSTGAGSFTGAMNVIWNQGASSTTLSGSWSNTGDLALNANGLGAIGLSTGTVNNTGKITNSGTGTGSTTISAAVGANVTGITQNSTTSALTVSGLLTSNATATTLTNSAGTKALTVSGGVANTVGNVVLKNDSSLANGISVSTNVLNNSGTVTNSGSGSGSTLISAVIGTGVTGVMQNSATSQLTLNGANTFTGGLSIRNGTVQVGSATGVGAGLVTLGSAGHSATLDLNGQTETVFSLATAGTAANQTIGNSSTTTSAVLNYTGATTSTFGGVIQDVLGGGNRTAGVTVNNAAASLTLSGANTYTGATTVSAGSLLVTGSLANGVVNVASAATLGGTGTIGGAVTIANGGKLAPGVGGAGTLSLGSLVLNLSSNLNFDLGTPGVIGGVTNDLLQVAGNLTLDGNLHVADAGGFGFGSYRLINYGGALTNNGLVLGTTPGGFTGDFAVQTSVAGQVNLIVSPASGILFWDGPQLTANGVVNGGSSSWSNTLTNWTNAGGTVQSAWNGGMAVFTGAVGAVKLGENVTTTGLQFSTNGYSVNAPAGLGITLGGTAEVRVDPGVGATINAPLAGGGLTKTGTGTLTLAGASTYTGGTTVADGLLIVQNAAGAGLGTGPVTVLGTLTSELRFVNAASAGGVAITNAAGGLNVGSTTFRDSSTAGGSTITNSGNGLAGGGGGNAQFFNNSNAGTATIANRGAAFSSPTSPGFTTAGGGQTFFGQSSSAKSATITNFAGLGSSLQGGQTFFTGSATAGTATIANRGGAVAGAIGGSTQFFNTTLASAVTLIADGGTNGGFGGTMVFKNASSGGTARVIFNPGDAANGALDISGLTSTGTTVGSIEGNGLVFLGSKRLSVGTNNTSTTFSGLIRDGGFLLGIGGSLGKVGTGSLTLSGDNTYTGGTLISLGNLIVTNPNGTALGTGPASVRAPVSGLSILNFQGTASAGGISITNERAASAAGRAYTIFEDNATASTARITSQASAVLGGFGGILLFRENARAGSAQISNLGAAVSDAVNGDAVTLFRDNSNAESAVFTNFGSGAQFAQGGSLEFYDSSSAGASTITLKGGAGVGGAVGFGGRTFFVNNATASTANILVEQGGSGGAGGLLDFLNAATADRATITIQGSASAFNNGLARFGGAAVAGTALLNLEGGRGGGGQGGQLWFLDNASAGGATLQMRGGAAANAPGGGVIFYQQSNAGNATLKNFAGDFAGAASGKTVFSQSPDTVSRPDAAASTILNEGGKFAFQVGGLTEFRGLSQGGSGLSTNRPGQVDFAYGGETNFYDQARAGTRRFINEGGAVVNSFAGGMFFLGSSSADNASIDNRGAPAAAQEGGVTFFQANSSAGSATIINEESAFFGNLVGSGSTQFSGSASAGSASILNRGETVALGRGGETYFFAGTTAGSATLTNEAGTAFGGSGPGKVTLSGASAGRATFLNLGSTVTNAPGGFTFLTNGSTGGTATFFNRAGTVAGANSGLTYFASGSLAGNALIENDGGSVASTAGGTTIFSGSTSAGAAIIRNHAASVANGGRGTTYFTDSATAGNSTLYIDAGVGTGAGGAVIFQNTAEGGTARAILAGTGTANGGLDLGLLTDAGMSIGSIEGDGIVSLGKRNLTVGTNNLTTVYSGLIRDGGLNPEFGGSLTKVGTGSLTLDGANTFTGRTNILQGLLRVNGSLAGGAYVQNATLGGKGTIAGGVIVGPGGIVNPGASPGTLTVVGDFLQQPGGTLQMEIAGPNPADTDHLIVTGKLTLGGILELDFLNGFAPQTGAVFNLFSFATLAGQFTGVEVTGLAQGWQFTLDPTGSTLSLTAQSNAVSQPEFLVKPGPNTLLAGGGQIAPGIPVHFTGGTLEAASDTVLDNPVIVGLAGAIFQSDAGTSAILNGVLFGPGALMKTGPGALTLTAANIFAGDTFIADGSLFVDGSLASPRVFVLAGGLLGGNGTLFGNVFNSGIVSPGHSPGTLRIGGNFTQFAAGTLRIEVGGRNAGEFDRLVIGGHASLDGTLQLVRLNNFRLKRGDRLEFLTADQGVSGKFATVINPFTSATILEPRVVYGANSVALEMVQGSFAEFAGRWQLTPNQRAVARGLDGTAFDKRADKLIGYLDDRLLTKLPGDFDRIAPEELTSVFTIGTSLAQVQGLNLQRRTADLRSGANGFSAAGLAMSGSAPSFSGGFGAAGPAGGEGKDSKAVFTPAPDNRWGVFLTGVGEWVKVGATDRADGYDITTGGFTLGVDYQVCPGFAVGLSAGYAGTGADLSRNGRVWVNGGKLGLYATAYAGGFYADVAVSGGVNSYDTRRTALQGDARGSTDGSELNVLFATGYDWKFGALTIGPTASFQYTYLSLDGFTERGSLAPLAIQNGSGESLRAAFGCKASYDWRVGRGVLIKPEIRAAWQHESGDRAYGLASSFANGASGSFNVTGPQIGRDSALIGAGFAIQWSDRLSTYFYYDGQIGRSNYDSHSITGGLRVIF